MGWQNKPSECRRLIRSGDCWREGKVIFRTEQLGDAVRRINRYSQIQIEIDDLSLASRPISGVFETGDTQGTAGLK